MTFKVNLNFSSDCAQTADTCIHTLLTLSKHFLTNHILGFSAETSPAWTSLSDAHVLFWANPNMFENCDMKGWEGGYAGGTSSTATAPSESSIWGSLFFHFLLSLKVFKRLPFSSSSTWSPMKPFCWGFNSDLDKKNWVPHPKPYLDPRQGKRGPTGPCCCYGIFEGTPSLRYIQRTLESHSEPHCDIS